MPKNNMKRVEDNSDNLNDYLRMRIEKSELAVFKQKSERSLGKPYALFIREIVKAFNDGRLRIIPTNDQKDSLGELYNVDRK
jgi:hypothetical protein